ncbi:hypothetical protein ScPMuIL_012716 [Solemya velum]
MAASSVATAAAVGDLQAVNQLVKEGVDLNKRDKDGMTPLGIAAFWGYADIVQSLLEAGADVNAANSGSMWTPLHCAAFQDHGKVVMKLFEGSRPDLTCKDKKGRTPVDFASALDSIWPFFAAAGCIRTSKSDLIRMEIVHKAPQMNRSSTSSDHTHFTSTSPNFMLQPSLTSLTDATKALALSTGDVLAGAPDEMSQWQTNSRKPSFTVWNR